MNSRKNSLLWVVLLLCGLCLAASTAINLSTQTTGAISNAQFPGGLTNANSAQQSQTVVSGTAYYLTSSNLTLPATLVNGIKAGTTLYWHATLTKTAAGTGTFQIVLYAGTHGTTSDTAEVSQSIGTQTAAVDTMNVDVQITFVTVGSSGSFYWSITPIHQAATATGFGVSVSTGAFTGTVSSFNTTTASLIFGLGFISTTGTPTITVPCVISRATNLD